jgi:glutamine synthetase adenylyltransferase
VAGASRLPYATCPRRWPPSPRGALESQCERLLTAYRFLRRVENILQEIGDQQTQTLPTEDRDRQRLIATLGFTDWDAFMAHLDEEMAAVHQEFVAVVGEERKPRPRNSSGSISGAPSSMPPSWKNC